MEIAVWCANATSNDNDSGGPPNHRPFVLVRADDDPDSLAHRTTADEFDRALILRIREDDPAALDQLLRRYAVGLARYASAIVGSTDLAEDVVQDVFIKLWERRHVALRRGHVAGYLLRMTRNRALNVKRHERVHHNIARASMDPAILHCEVHNAGELALEAAELDRLVREAIDALPGRARDVFLMRRQAKMPATAVAEALGISPAAVHVHLSRALRRIAMHIASHIG